MSILKVFDRFMNKKDVPKDDLLHRVATLVRAAEALFGAGYGGAKRNHVYSQLQKDFPQVSKRKLSFAIEDYLREH